MNAPSYDIAMLLTEYSELGLTFASNLFISSEPASPDNVVTVYDTTSGSPVLFLDNQYKYYYPSVQVRIRDNSYQNGYALGKAIMDIVHGDGYVTGDTTYTVMQATSNPFLLEYDENRRAVFILNINLQRR